MKSIPAFPILPITKRLTFRILLTTLIGLALTLATIGYTLHLSWQLEGGAAAINQAGSLRMLSYRLAQVLEHAKNNQEIVTELDEFSRTLTDLQTGDPRRPLLLPYTSAIYTQMRNVQSDWQQHIQIHAINILQEKDPQRKQQALQQYAQELPIFVGRINTLVSLVEVDLSDKTTWLRLCQTALIFMSLAASVALLYLLYLWIIGPVTRMQIVMARMSKDDLSVRLPIETENEFGVLAQAFNQMADHVQVVHRTLEERVHAATQKLLAQNHEMSTLYELAGFLAGPHSIEELCRGFLHGIMQRISAEGGTVRILDNETGNLHITVHEGIPEAIIEEEHCIKTDDCLCGTATQQGIILVKDFRQLDQKKQYRCQKEGFFSMAVFQILAREHVIGSFSLFFTNERVLSSEECRLLEILGKNLGVAIENQRLIAKEKEFAVSQERNLLAQSLHDSIAQGLNYLNLQVQMLEDSIKRHNFQEIIDITPLLRAGVEESYEDVRELLLNFRTRLQDNNLESEMRNVLGKFQRQTGVHGDIQFIGSGAAMAPVQQLQVLFILQEALSNVRKHAQASEVTVRVENERDFNLTISDDGQGFSLNDVSAEEEAHVGLHIMQERAERLSAQLNIRSMPGAGTTISLHLRHQERLVA